MQKLQLASRRVLFVIAIAALVSCGGGDGTAAEAPDPVSRRMVAELPANTSCPQADNQTLVYAGVECLVVRTFGTPVGGGQDKLVVFLHGDVSAGGPADYMDKYATDYVGAGVVVVRMLRPGYYDTDGHTSTGSNYNRTDSYPARNVDAVAYALAMLRQYYGSSRLVVVGHSGGASIAATILGRYPALIDSVALMACPCDLRAWRSTWTRSQSALEHVSGVPLTAHVVAMTGTADTQVPTVYSSIYVNALRSRGIAAQQLDIPAATHSASTIFTNVEVQAQIRSLIR